MHFLRDIRQNPEAFRSRLERRGEKPDLSRLLDLDRQRRERTTTFDALRQARNLASKRVGEEKRRGGDTSALEEEVRAIGDQIQAGEAAVRDLDQAIDAILLSLPNLPADSTPDGRDASANVVVRTVGDTAAPVAGALDHLDFAERLGLLDFKRGSKIAGSGFPVWTGAGARLERALINFLLDLQTGEHHYREMMTPFLGSRETMTGSGQIPRLEDDMYHIEQEDLFLIPTSEVTLVNLHRDEVLPEAALPLRYTAYSPCFRRESGSYGQATRGFLRVHQFNKVELVRFEHPDRSYEALEELVGHAEEALKRLELPYRVLRLCAGDMGFNAAACYDLECWAPVVGKWLEVSSCSNCEAFQARRANIRFRSAATGKTDYVHTLNGSGLATSRLMVAILENYQTDEGVLAVPPVLRPYLGGSTHISAV